MPVPKDARLVIYKYSPSFARLKFFFDPEDGKPVWDYPCASTYRGTKVDCSDIPAGWFIWALRNAASRIGMHRDANTAARFYQSIADEVEAACTRGDLKCGPWLPHFVSYMTVDQMLSLPQFLWATLKLFAMAPPMSFEPMPSSFVDRKAEVLALLNNPPHEDVGHRRLFTAAGWYRGHGDEWISISGGSLKDPLTVRRVDSPDLVSHFSDPQLKQNRFNITGACIERMSCNISFTDDRHATINIDIASAKFPTGVSLGEGTLYVDAVTWQDEIPWTVRNGLFDWWVKVIRATARGYPILIFIGYLASFVVFGQALFWRHISPATVIIVTLGTAIFTRAVLLALVSASSFPAIVYPYGAPGVTLSVVLAVLAILQFVPPPRTVTEHFDDETSSESRQEAC